ncbi:hypothetical protein H310_03231 [Aphanomyces invadans]|uniref:Aromatic amino acid beta-eliminating lyase/threonine aldolase domain-containing protein n=1 Tax=Aphanomyces invadans TaxID=157072 RepID=A0A024UIQ4_9STRA|nr:hypothetical protein H310_03231 [Aphanomyces invadans]ETW05468.1 hypothetical protein H310_03231 [Aphanomyces invadans]|eukprot:XP_008865245.1 hypothetical protein H310_03231 [Aphanomyces invadans]
MTTAPVTLTSAHKPKTPVELLSQLSEDAQSLGITAFDVYGDFSNPSSWLNTFQGEVAARLGKPRALFVPSGVMAQGIALKIHAENTKRTAFVARHNSHLHLHEQDAFKHLWNLEAIIVPPPTAVVPPGGFHPSLSVADVDTHTNIPSSPPAAVVIELPEREIGGKLIPFDQLQRMTQLARSRGAAVHMDGARLWEAEAGYSTNSIHEVTALFDSIYVSFYKGLGGITGAMLLGDNAFIDAAQVWLRRFGGNLYSQLPYAVSSWAGFRRYPRQTFESRRRQMQAVVAAVTQAVPVISFDPPVPHVSMVHVYLPGSVAQVTAARDAAEAATGIRVFVAARPSKIDTARSYFELNMGAHNIDIPIETWVRGWTAFGDALQRVCAEGTPQ